MIPSESAEDEILFREEGRAALVTLNRPRVLNAISLEMVRKMEQALHRYAATPRIYGVVMEGAGRAFCAGGDIRAARADPSRAPVFYAEEYQNCWTLRQFTKPHVALIHGAWMGGGVGFSVYGTHRVMAPDAMFAMPEVAIGFYPNVGVSWLLGGMPGRIGLYLGLTGAIIGPADAYPLGLATHCIAAAQFPQIKAAMISGEPIDPVLGRLHEAPAPSRLLRLRPVIDRVFGAGSPQAILAALDAETQEAAWASEAAAAMRRAGPFALELTHRLLTAPPPADAKAALARDYGLSLAMAARPDYAEGVRAKLIDRDGKPAWQPARLADVAAAEVDAVWREGETNALALVDHWRLVA